MEFIYFTLMLVAVAAFVSYPFWGDWRATVPEDPAIAALEAAREAKYRERCARLDSAARQPDREGSGMVVASIIFGR